MSRKSGNFPLVFLLLMGLAGCSAHRGGNSSTPEQAQESAPNKRALAYYMDGLAKDMDQNHGAALLSYQEALLYDSTSADIYLAITRDYLLLDKEALAEQSIQKALKLNPGHIEAWEIVADLEMRKGNIERVRSVIKTILALDSTNALALNQSSYLALREGDLDKAVRHIDDLMRQGVKPMPSLLMGVSEQYLEKGEYDKGLNLFQKLLDIDPFDALSYWGMGMFEEVRGDTAAAVRHYVQALDILPVFPEVTARLSQIYIAQKKWDDGLALFNQAIAFDSTDVEAYLGISALLQGMGRVDSSMTVLQRTAERFPRDARASYDLGQLFMQQERYSDAYKAFAAVTSLLPQNGGAWLNSGLAMLFADSLGKAETCFRRAVQFLPQIYQPSFYLGTVLTQQNKNEEAVQHLEEALSKNPPPGGSVLVMSTLASAYDALKEYARSDTLFEKSMRLDPENATVLNNYAYSLCQRDERLQEARGMAEKALQIEPENASFLDTMGWILFKMNEHGPALELIEQSWSIRPESAEVADHMGDIYQALGRNEDALRMWKTSLRLVPDNPKIEEKLKLYE